MLYSNGKYYVYNIWYLKLYKLITCPNYDVIYTAIIKIPQTSIKYLFFTWSGQLLSIFKKSHHFWVVYYIRRILNFFLKH